QPRGDEGKDAGACPDVDHGVTRVDGDAFGDLEARPGGGEHAGDEQDREGATPALPGVRPLLGCFHPAPWYLGALGDAPTRRGAGCRHNRVSAGREDHPWTSTSVRSRPTSSATSPWRRRARSGTSPGRRSSTTIERCSSS